MNDNQVIAVLISVMRMGLDEIGLTDVQIRQNYQPRKVGVSSQPVLYFHKISAPRYGFPGRRDSYNSTNRNFDHSESIWRTPTFQVNGLSTQNPADINQLTASDIVEQTADVLQQSNTRTRLLAQKIGIFRITQIREDYFHDDRDRFEQSPSFDFTLSYRRVIDSTVQPVTDFSLNCHQV